MPIQAVAIVVYEGVQALDVAGPMDVFSEANTFLGSADRYETVLVAAHRNPLRASNGIRLVADLTFEEAASGFEIILVAGAPTPPEAPLRLFFQSKARFRPQHLPCVNPSFISISLLCCMRVIVSLRGSSPCLDACSSWGWARI